MERFMSHQNPESERKTAPKGQATTRPPAGNADARPEMAMAVASGPEIPVAVTVCDAARAAGNEVAKPAPPPEKVVTETVAIPDTATAETGGSS
jgi:hypothetical protein